MKKKEEKDSISSDGSNVSDKVHLHTTVDQRTYHQLKRLSLQYGNISRAIEQAVMLLTIRSDYSQIRPIELDDYQLSHYMRTKFSMISVGRRTFLSYIDNLPDKPIKDKDSPIKDNNAKELIEWFSGKEINEMSLEDIINAIKRLWQAANYFSDVRLEPILTEHAIKYKVIFFHNFNTVKYGEYWTKYFRFLFESLGCTVDSSSRNESFHLIITKKLP